jgi:hypothetical protein
VGPRYALAAFALAAWVAACGSTPAPGAADDASAPGDDGGAPLATFDADPTPPTSVNGVTPSRAFLARHEEIKVSGFSASWTNATRVDLGSGIAITNLSAPTPDLLVVDFGVDLGAATGPRDVTVLEADGGKEVAPGALAVDPPVALSFDGTLAQGSIAVAHVGVLDPTIPLDVTSVTDPFGNASFPHLSPAFGAGISGTVIAAKPYEADIQIFIDETTAGTSNFDLVSGAPGDTTDAHFPLPAGLSIAQRTAQPLVAGTAVSGGVAGKYATALFSYTPPSTALGILDFHAASTASGADPAVLLLPASGRWSDELIGGADATWLSAWTDPVFAVYFDDSGQTGTYSVGLTVTAPAATAAASASDATQSGAVVATGLPFVLTGGNLTSSSSQDWVRVTTGAGDAGKQLRAQSAGDPKTFLDVTVYQADGTTSVGGNERGGPVDAVVGPLAASSTYYVVFSAGAGFDPAHGAYAGIIRIQ